MRTLLCRLEAKGLGRRTAGPDGFVYAPVPRTDAVAEGARRRMVETFFAGSAASAATALLGLGQTLTADEAEALRRTIDRMGASGEGRDRS